MGAEEKIIVINDIISCLEEVKQDSKLLDDFMVYSEVHGVHVKNKQNQIIESRKIYKNIEIVLPIDDINTISYPIETTLEPF